MRRCGGMTGERVSRGVVGRPAIPRPQCLASPTQPDRDDRRGGIALGMGMTMLAVSQASVDLFTGDFRASSAALYVTTEGGKPVPILAGETPGTIDDARHVLAQLRGLPGVTDILAVMTWTLERERPGPKVGTHQRSS